VKSEENCRWLLTLGAVLFFPLSEGCTATQNTKHTAQYAPGQRLIIVADYDQIEETVDPDSEPETNEPAFLEEIVCLDCIPSAPPNIMDWVYVRDVHGSRVLFESGPRGRHRTPFFGWVDEDLLISPSQFEPVVDWPGKWFLTEVCVEYVGCRQAYRHSDGDLEISFSGTRYDASCPFERDEYEFCRTNGHVDIFGKYLVFVTGRHSDSTTLDGERRLGINFIVQQDGRLCWAQALQDYDVCLPLNAEYYKPELTN
jgi:hypothetical protein